MIAGNEHTHQMELEMRLREALDRFHQGQETLEDLAIINWHLGINYRPPHHQTH